MFFAIPNLSADKVFPVEPWTFEPKMPAEALASKEARWQWCQKPSTRHCHYSAFEGADRARRVDKSNPPMYMSGIVSDFDAPVDGEMRDALLAGNKWPCTVGPTWFCQTLSGRARLIWLFEKPALVNAALATSVLQVVRKDLHMSKWLPQLDDCFNQWNQYYEVGKEWHKVPGTEPVPEGTVQKWLYEAGSSLQEDSMFQTPIEKVAEEVEKRFPGRWAGPFEPGARGVRFWDPTADNPTAAIVREHGMQCFSGTKAWMTWSEIFGEDFTRKLEAGRMGALCKDVCYDGTQYWVLDVNDSNRTHWRPKSKEDFRQELAAAGVSQARKKGETASPLDRVEIHIKNNLYVSRVLPFVHFPSGFMWHEGKPVLNLSTVKCLDPAPEGSVDGWVDGVDSKFPWLAKFLIHFFDPDNQLQYFLAWLKHFYANAYIQKPRPGHAIVMAGKQGVGKTFMASGVVGGMVGGSVDAVSYLAEGSIYTALVAESPVMRIDDSSPTDDPSKHARFTSVLKKIVANKELIYNEKYIKAGKSVWLGRPMISCNFDPESLRILPGVGQSNLDKMMFLRTNDSSPVILPGQYEQEEILRRELPFFCRFLLDWTIPKELISSDPRFHVKAYHHPEMVQTSQTNSTSYSVFELLAEFLENEKAVLPKGTMLWEGTTQRLFRLLHAYSPAAMKRIDPSRLKRELQQLELSGFPVKQKRRNGSIYWHLPLDLNMLAPGK